MTNLDRLTKFATKENFEVKTEETEYLKMFSVNDSYILVVSKPTKSINNLKVPVELQNKGMGGLLVELAKELGVSNLMAEAHGEGMEQEDLINFYKNHGFEVKADNGISAYMELS